MKDSRQDIDPHGIIHPNEYTGTFVTRYGIMYAFRNSDNVKVGLTANPFLGDTRGIVLRRSEAYKRASITFSRGCEKVAPDLSECAQGKGLALDTAKMSLCHSR